MKFWFTRKTPKEAHDGKAPYDATVEQVLRVAQEVNSAPAELDRDVVDFATFDFSRALRPQVDQDVTPESTDLQTSSAFGLSRPKVSRAAREEMERRTADYRAFQMKLNEEREARIRRTMDDVRARLKQSAQDPSIH